MVEVEAWSSATPRPVLVVCAVELSPGILPGYPARVHPLSGMLLTVAPCPAVPHTAGHEPSRHETHTWYP